MEAHLIAFIIVKSAFTRIFTFLLFLLSLAVHADKFAESWN